MLNILVQILRCCRLDSEKPLPLYKVNVLALQKVAAEAEKSIDFHYFTCTFAA